MASLMSEASMDLGSVDSSHIFLADELGGAAGDLRRAIPEITGLTEARDTLCRKHFEDRLFNRYYISTIKRDPKTGWLLPMGCKTMIEFFEKGDKGHYLDDNVQAAWEGYKIAMQLFEI